MIHYSMFLKLWIKLCPRCQIAVINFRYTPPELLKTEKWTKEFIARYLLLAKTGRLQIRMVVLVIIKIVKLIKNL